MRIITKKMGESASASKRKGLSAAAVTKKFQARIAQLKEKLKTSKAEDCQLTGGRSPTRMKISSYRRLERLARLKFVSLNRQMRKLDK
mmetsp:Transcript_18656/g.28791  ORF Transcript_18656/g.28791 Transcript_18656/m.28791 type:complete len:88 (-) Transcript_18656:119-382(-)